MKKSNKKWKSIRLLVPLVLLIVVLLLDLFFFNNHFGPAATKRSMTKVISQAPSSSTSQAPTILNGLVEQTGKTYFYKNGVKQSGFQEVDGQTDYFDPLTFELLAQMRPMTGNYWQLSSELNAYPNLATEKNLSIDVDLEQQRLFLKSGTQVIYIMYISSGINDGTPLGNYAVQSERGLSFYNASENEGANYWVSWLDHGVYLFHTVPTDKNGNYIISEAEKLGHETASHGCVRLSISDAKWLYENIPVGTPVSLK